MNPLAYLPHGPKLAEVTKAINTVPDSEVIEFSKTLKWGTYGPNGDQAVKVRYIYDLDTEHLENILVTQPHIGPVRARTILVLLKHRYRQLFLA
jgi:hypothetical protein